MSNNTIQGELLAEPAARAPTRGDRSSLAAQMLLSLRSVPVFLAFVVLTVVSLLAVFAPFLIRADPIAIDPLQRFAGVSAEHWLGNDAFGRDVYSRLLFGARVSLIVGLGAAAASLVIGLIIGVVAGYIRFADTFIMRVMDGIMAIPSILLAIALVSLTGASLVTVLVAITVPEIPRVVRLVRSIILNVRSEAYVEAAISLGTPTYRLLIRHMVPNTVAPLIVQGTFIFASAILTEATLSFLGAGLPTEIPSWGNMMADGRMYFQLYPSLVLYPGIILAFTLLSVNILGDVLRDVLDPKMAKRT
ncbi:binding-protein-dependent transport systems inner membrane component [Nitratireductor aquibiodomus RA22]|uniref:Binding-protein-dependent transport systems inner membrane component n=1 Tax=Nitratireductor aquibiodomus RA22 TaxID=1189611 RepID=I5BYU9_9HYPH|nr:ABC transporter permease [Nitratireductor aquibiodomus]EIM74751.1 binding-protein-dependent transport systems inner membrane component [Nitratireductor aquibiodomus RA22]